MRFSLIIAAGGTGNRMQSSKLKQFSNLNNKPVIVHTVEKFLAFSAEIEILCPLPPDALDLFKELQNNFAALKHVHPIKGGKTRFMSVKNALNNISADYIAIHDAVRPLISIKLIKRAFEEAQNFGNAVPAIPLENSLRMVVKTKNQAINRSNFRLIQTPQIFEQHQLIKSYSQKYKENFTDDASVVEAAGYPIHLIPGERTNIKITHPEDLKIAESLIE